MNNPIPADLRSAVYASVLSNADESTVDKFIELHNKTDLQEEKMRLATALGSVRSEELIKKILEFAISPAVRSQDSVSIICSVSSNPSSKLASKLSWNFLKDNWSLLKTRYASGFLITRLVKTLAGNFATEKDAAEVEEFFTENPCSAAQRSIQQALENIKINAKWLKREEHIIKICLRKSSMKK